MTTLYLRQRNDALPNHTKLMNYSWIHTPSVVVIVTDMQAYYYIYSYHSLQLKKVAPVSLSCSPFFPQLFHFFISHLSFFSSFFSSYGVLSPPLSTSPVSKSFCPSIMIVDLGFVKLCLLFLLSPFFLKLFWNLYSIWFHLLFTILIVSFCLLFHIFFFLLHRLSSSIPPAN